MKDKTNIKIILAMIITAIVSIGGTVLAESALNANQINYNNTTVADALDGMYRINSFQTNYSTDEKVVGTWIDGRPLYQITITPTSPSSTIASKIYENNEIDFMVSFDGYLTHNGTSIQGAQPLNWIYSTSRYTSTWWDNSSKALYMVCSSSYEQNKGLTITIQYTKTTD